MQADFHEKIVRDPIHHSPKKLDDDQSETKQRDPDMPVTTRRWTRTKKIVHDQFKRPRLEKIQTDGDERQKQSKNGLSKERSVVTEDAPVDRHLNLGLRIFVFRLN